MARPFLIFLTFLAATGVSFADEQQPRDYYIRLMNRKGDVEVGWHEGIWEKRHRLFRGSASELSRSRLRALLNLPDDSSEVLVYIHCWLGNERHFHGLTLHTVNKAVNRDSASRIRYTVSLVWQSAFRGYRGNWNRADDAGRSFSGVFGQLMRLYGPRLNLLAHSMGNRLLQGMLQSLPADSMEGLKLREAVLVGADVRNDVFENDFRRLTLISERVHVFFHGRDRLLLAAAALEGNDRLGRTGPARLESLLSQVPNLYVTDVTDSAPPVHLDMSNHVYFFMDSAVLACMRDVYAHKAIEDRDRRRVLRW